VFINSLVFIIAYFFIILTKSNTPLLELRSSTNPPFLTCSITNKIKELAIEHVKNGGLVDDLNSNKGVLDFVKIIKKYAIIKTRELMNTIN
jgi:hypothetical protein